MTHDVKACYHLAHEEEEDDPTNVEEEVAGEDEADPTWNRLGTSKGRGPSSFWYLQSV